MRGKIRPYLLILAIPLFFLGCAGDNGDSGTLKVYVTDAKPVLPSGTEQVLITFEEVMVHKAGGDWVSLPLVQIPYTINLLQFSGGATTRLVPPVELDSGKYTQVRIVVTAASILFSGDPERYEVEVPSGKLRTDKNFDFDVAGGAAVDLTVDFDLSQSIVVTGSDRYELKPVLHINETQAAAKIFGEIAAATFGTATAAVVVVTWDKDNSGDKGVDDEEYTRLQVEKGIADPTGFAIFWLVPNQSYIVEVVVEDTLVYTETVNATDLIPGADFELNGGNPI